MSSSLSVYMRKPLTALQLEDFDAAPIWATDVVNCDEETFLPVPGKTQIEDGESDIWVRVSGRLADGTPIRGIAMVETPPPQLLLLSFYANKKWLPLVLPPAPEFVLGWRGPLQFARALSKSLSDVFPMQIQSEVTLASTGKPILHRISINESPDA